MGACTLFLQPDQREIADVDLMDYKWKGVGIFLYLYETLTLHPARITFLM